MIKRILNSKIFKQPDLVTVYSHPRSGTHFLEAFLANNFYPGKDLNIPIVKWGHWSNRKEKLDGNPHGKLFGNHYFADKNINDKPKIYIYRDGRAVAYSIWKTNNFINKEYEGISFSDFLRMKIDWHGTPAIEHEPIYNIIEHWSLHVKSWVELAEKDDNLLILNYEELIDNPYEQYEKIHLKFFKRRKKLKKDKIDVINKPIGLLPNRGTKDAWEETFSKSDIEFFGKVIANMKMVNSLKK